MLTQDERFEMMLDIMNRLVPELRNRRRGRKTRVELSAVSPSPSPTRAHRPIASPHLHSFLDRLGPVPPYQATLGVCEDGLPFLFDMRDPLPGSLLVLADADTGKTHLLRSLLYSAILLNSRQQFACTVIARQLEEYAFLIDSPHCNGLISCDEPIAHEHLLERIDYVEKHAERGLARGVQLTAIDDLASLLRYQGAEISAALRWLLNYAARAGVWVVATLRPDDFRRIGSAIPEQFGTPLVGPVARRPAAPAFDEITAGLHPQSLVAGQFAALLGREWVRFSLLGLD